MKFIIDTDWGVQVRASVLAIVKNSDAALNDAIDIAVSEAASYLRGKYDAALIFSPIILWDATVSYPKATRLQLSAPAFSTMGGYAVGKLVVYNDIVYQSHAIVPAGSWDASKWTEVAKDKSIFSVAVAHSTAGYVPGLSNEFISGDSRYPILLMYTKDIALYHIHSNISPQNIPALRKDRYDAAIKWLLMVSKDQLNADLPLLDPTITSNTMRFAPELKYSQKW